MIFYFIIEEPFKVILQKKFHTLFLIYRIRSFRYCLRSKCQIQDS